MSVYIYYSVYIYQYILNKEYTVQRIHCTADTLYKDALYNGYTMQRIHCIMDTVHSITHIYTLYNKWLYIKRMSSHS